MLKISSIIDKMNTFIGKFFAYAILIAIFVSAYNAVVRKFATQLASNAFLDMQWQLFGFAFMLAAPWTLFLNEHIRIDVLSSRMSQSARCWVDIIGHLFILIPFSLFMVYVSFPKALRSFQLAEQSLNAGGLPQWPAKAVIPAAFALLFLQAISEIIKRIAVLRGQIADPHQAASTSENIAHNMEFEG